MKKLICILLLASVLVSCDTAGAIGVESGSDAAVTEVGIEPEATVESAVAADTAEADTAEAETTEAETTEAETTEAETTEAEITEAETTEAETTEAETTEAETTEAETTEAETTEAETTEAETTEAETTEAETSAVEEPPVTVYTERPKTYYSRDTVYLTFDDGPGRYTEEVLRILDEYGVKATFFVVGTSVLRYPDQLRLIAEAGHSIGAHSMTHAYYTIYASPEAIVEDLEAWELTVFDVLGYLPADRLYRFPGGTNCLADGTDFSLLRDTLESHDYRSFDWTFANNDKYTVNMREDQTMVDFLKESSVTTLSITGRCKIMLLHETTPETVEMLPWLIEYLQGEGYTLAPLTYANVGYTFAS